MANAITTLSQLKKADKLTKLAMRKNGPRSYQRGIGVLLRYLGEAESATRDELIEKFCWSRHNLKNIAKKAQRKGLVEITAGDAEAAYSVFITETGKEVLAKRAAADTAAAEKILSCLSAEEIDQLNAITEKLIVAAKAEGVKGFGKDRKIHKGHKGHRPHSEIA